jgi:hypothetical protein
MTAVLTYTQFSNLNHRRPMKQEETYMEANLLEQSQGGAIEKL